MLTVGQLFDSPALKDAVLYELDEKPVYVRLPDGSLHQVDAVGEAQIRTSAGAHDVVILAVSGLTSEAQEG
jgi:hypothetical protein